VHLWALSPLLISRLVVTLTCQERVFDGVLLFPTAMQYCTRPVSVVHYTVWQSRNTLDQLQKSLAHSGPESDYARARPLPQQLELVDSRLGAARPVRGEQFQGHWVWKFEIVLPSSLDAGIFYKDLVTQYYEINARLVVPFRADGGSDPSPRSVQLKTEMVYLDVYGTNQIRWEKLVLPALQPSQSRLRFHDDKVELNCSLPRVYFVLGETVPFRFTVQNQSSKAAQIKVELYQNIDIHSPNYSRRIQQIKIASRTLKEEFPRRVTSSRELQFRLPASPVAEARSLALPSHQGKLFDITHQFHVIISDPSLLSRGFRGNTSFDIPVTLLDMLETSASEGSC
jgi:hypothetical protein